MKIVGIEVLGDQTFGDGGFLVLHRTRLHNIREDGSHSESYVCDYVDRPRALDAVVVAIYHRTAGQVRVLIRDGLRLPLHLVRGDRIFCSEVVAGLIEEEDVGETGIRQRAALEVHEEAGLTIDPDTVISLGAKSHPSAGVIAESFYSMAVEISDPSAATLPPGDGSPFEEGATIRWLELDEAIAACVRGDINDLKTEVCLRRLRDHLHPRA